MQKTKDELIKAIIDVERLLVNPYEFLEPDPLTPLRFPNIVASLVTILMLFTLVAIAMFYVRWQRFWRRT